MDLEYVELTTNAIMGQPAFALATEQELNEKVESDASLWKERKWRKWMQESRSGPTPPGRSLSHAEALLPIHSTNRAPCLSLRLNT